MLLKANKRPPFTKLADKFKKKIDEFVKRYKKKPTEADLSKEIAKINLELKNELKTSSDSIMKKAYLRGMNQAEKNLGFNVTFGTVDQSAIDVLSNQEVLTKAYDGISSEITNKLNDIIKEAYHTAGGLSVKSITDKIADTIKVADFRAENIARTETSKVSAAARVNSYKKENDFGNFLFKWIGPNDRRTTEVSKRIKQRTKNGVRWNDLVKIVTEESSSVFPTWTVNKDFPVSHWSSRHTFVRIAN